jgi:hypothetical protein
MKKLYIVLFVVGLASLMLISLSPPQKDIYYLNPISVKVDKIEDKVLGNMGNALVARFPAQFQREFYDKLLVKCELTDALKKNWKIYKINIVDEIYEGKEKVLASTIYYRASEGPPTKISDVFNNCKKPAHTQYVDVCICGSEALNPKLQDEVKLLLTKYNGLQFQKL